MPEATALPNKPSFSPLAIYWPLLVGVLALYLPTYYALATGAWNTEAEAHGPIVLAVSIYLAWNMRGKATQLHNETLHKQTTLGWMSLLFGLVCYVIGRSQDILLFETGSQFPVFLGILLMTLGWRGVKLFWFPLFFLLFMVPPPGVILDAVTNPLKQEVSHLASHFLYMAGYPIARSGVVITIGQYQLLVADACSGLHSIVSLSAMGSLYLYLMRHTNILRNLILIALIIPIAIVTNVARVMILALITYYFGDEAGQGFLHGFAGIMIFVVAVLLLFLFDAILGFVFPDKHTDGKSAVES